VLANVKAKIKIVSLHLYPIKSCGAVDVDEITVDERGPRWDRNWVVVDADGNFLTQRKFPQMAKIRLNLIINPSQNILRLVLPNLQSAELQLDTVMSAHSARQVQVWKDTCMGVDEPLQVSELISDFLGTRAFLVRTGAETRALPEKFSTLHGGFASVRFADSMPLLLTSLTSLQALNRRLAENAIAPVPMDRFRANIIIDGAPAFSEDQWQQVQLGSLATQGSKQCSRCTIVNTDQASGERFAEPLKTLAQFRRFEDGKIMFGKYLIQTQSGVVRVGDEISAGAL
jgi:uncharacterized protein YcbX